MGHIEPYRWSCPHTQRGPCIRNLNRLLPYLLSQETRLRISMKVVSKNTTRDNNKTQIVPPPLPMPIPPIHISINDKSRHFRLKLKPCMSIIWCSSRDPWICFLWIIAFSRIFSKASNSNSFPQCGQSKSPDASLSNSTSRLQCGHWMTTIGWLWEDFPNKKYPVAVNYTPTKELTSMASLNFIALVELLALCNTGIRRGSEQTDRLHPLWLAQNESVGLCIHPLILFESHHIQDNDVTKNGLIITRMAICPMCQY